MNPFKEDYKLSYSTAKRLQEGNPEKLAHFKSLPKDHPKRKQTKAMKEGVMIETALLEIEKFHNMYVQIDVDLPDEDTTNYAFLKNFATGVSIQEAKEASGIRLKVETIEKKLSNGWGEIVSFMKEAEGKELISTEDYDMCMGIREKIHKDSIFNDFFTENIQRKIEWTHESGQECQGYLDCDNGFSFLELKSIDSASLDNINRRIKSLCYDVQMVAYEEATNMEGTWLFVEKEAPYSYRWVMPSDDDREKGKKLWFKWVVDFKRLWDENLWDQGYEFFEDSAISISNVNRWIKN